MAWIEMKEKKIASLIQVPTELKQRATQLATNVLLAERIMVKEITQRPGRLETSLELCWTVLIFITKLLTF